LLQARKMKEPTMKRDEKRVFVIIHGHFYQPPRENPWTGRIERQSGAVPHHDWNELVAAQCYVPNTSSRILDPSLHIAGIVNNFEYLSFNVGPTLLSWLERRERTAYQKILAADRLSVRRHNGHGNAMAQAFSHPVLPLSGLRDQRTQVEWGKRDFRMRFGREPEGMWLPETAVNYITLEVLHEKGIKFTVLSPTQARRFRRIGGAEWKDCEKEPLDTSRPYRVYMRTWDGGVDDTRWVDVFFYNQPLSVSASFEHLLTNAESFGKRIVQEVKDEAGPQAIILATDGETFGHHEPFADMCMAYFFKKVAPRLNVEVTNFSDYLGMYEPEYEVDLKTGQDGLGTAWSCAHGLGRWSRDCGCSTGGLKHWNQAWRAPLRQAMRLLGRRADDLFEKQGAEICPDVWAARDDFIELVINPSVQAQERFCARHLPDAVERQSAATVLLKLCQMQLFGQYAQTSCGWFFADISGLEATQNLKYAARAIELAQELGNTELLGEFRAVLETAKSNVPEQGTGKDIFDRAVQRSHFGVENMAACFAISQLVMRERAIDTFHFAIKELRGDSPGGRFESAAGLLQITNRQLLESLQFAYFVVGFTKRDVRCYLRPVANEADYEALLDSLKLQDLSKIPVLFGNRYFTWTDMVPEAAERMMDVLIRDSLRKANALFDQIYQTDKDIYKSFVDTGLELPTEAREIARSTLTRLFTEELMSSRGRWTREAFSRAGNYLLEAASLGLRLDKSEAASLMNEDIASAAEGLRRTPTEESLSALVSIIDIANMLEVAVQKNVAEDAAMEYLESAIKPAMAEALRSRDVATARNLMAILGLLDRLNLSVQCYIKDMEKLGS